MNIGNTVDYFKCRTNGETLNVTSKLLFIAEMRQVLFQHLANKDRMGTQRILWFPMDSLFDNEFKI